MTTEFVSQEEFDRVARAYDDRRARREAIAVQTPWGPAQTVTKLSETVTHYTTASHGGYHVKDVSLALIKPEWRAYAKRWSGSENWFEEDCAWAAVALTFPSLFPAEGVEHAKRAIAWVERT